MHRALLRRDGHEFFGDGLDVPGRDGGVLFGKADQQGQVAESIDASGRSAGQRMQGPQGVRLEDRARRAGYA